LLLAEKQSITGVAGMTGELGINKHKDSGSQKKNSPDNGALFLFLIKV
jgi:hypothetical protein